MTVSSDSTGVRRDSDNVVKLVQSVACTLCQLRDPSTIIFTEISETNPKNGEDDRSSDPPISPTHSGLCQPKCLCHRSLDDCRIIKRKWLQTETKYLEGNV
jgi:hypothetical protein